MALPTITREVRTDFTANDSQLMRRAKVVSARLNTLSATATRVRGGMSKVFLPIAGIAGIGGAAGAIGMVKGLIDVNSNMETMTLSMANLLQQATSTTGGTLGFAEAMEKSTSAIADMRKAAVDTPAGLNEISDAFQKIAFSGTEAGKSTEELIALASDIATVDLGSIVKGTVAKDVAQILKGQGGAGVIDTVQLKTISAEAAKLSREGNKAAAFELIKGALAVDQELKKAFGASFEGTLATAKDQLSQMAEIAGGSVFDLMKGKLAEAAKWMTDNREQAEAMAISFGENIVAGAEKLIDGLTWIVEHKDELIGWAETLGKVWLGTFAVNGVAKLVSGFTTLSGIVGKLNLLPLLMNPIGLAVAAVAALGAAIAVIVGESEKVAAQTAQYKQDAIDAERRQKARDKEDKKFWRDFEGRKKTADKLLSDDPFTAIDPFQTAADAPISPKGTKPKKKGRRGFRAPKTVIDARGSRIEVTQSIRTDSPLRLASATLQGAFAALSQRPLSGTLGTGGIRLALGAG